MVHYQPRAQVAAPRAAGGAAARPVLQVPPIEARAEGEPAPPPPPPPLCTYVFAAFCASSSGLIPAAAAAGGVGAPPALFMALASWLCSALPCPALGPRPGVEEGGPGEGSGPAAAPRLPPQGSGLESSCFLAGSCPRRPRPGRRAEPEMRGGGPGQGSPRCPPRA